MTTNTNKQNTSTLAKVAIHSDVFNYSKRRRTILGFLCAFCFFSLNFISAENKRPILIERPERMFWEIKSGTSQIYVLGTIHVADDTFYPLEDTVLAAFNSADRLACELGSVEMENFPQKLKALILKSVNSEPDKNILKSLSEEEVLIVENKCGKENAEVLSVFEPWVLNLMLTESALIKTGLSVEKGVDMYLYKLADGRYIHSLDTVETQLKLLTLDLPWKEQFLILKKTIKDISKQEEFLQSITELKKLYLSDERQQLYYHLIEEDLKDMEEFSDELKAGYKSYKEKLIINRNTKWAEKFIDFLKKDGTTFIFAGAAHFCGENSVFEIMKKKKALNF